MIHNNNNENRKISSPIFMFTYNSIVGNPCTSNSCATDGNLVQSIRPILSGKFAND